MEAKGKIRKKIKAQLEAFMILYPDLKERDFFQPIINNVPDSYNELINMFRKHMMHYIGRYEAMRYYFNHIAMNSPDSDCTTINIV